MSQATGPYRLEIEKNGCDHCGSGKTWDVVDPDGVAGGTSYGDRDEAEELAGWLNEAYARGKEDSGAPEVLEALKTIEAALLNRNVELPDPKALIQTARLAIDKADGRKVPA